MQTSSAHRFVRLAVSNVVVDGNAVEIELVIHYMRATPVCCGEPSCYLGFLGLHRDRVPVAIGQALGVDSPAVTIRAQLQHEPGFRYIDHATGQLLDEGVDQVVIYTPDDFVVTRSPDGRTAS